MPNVPGATFIQGGTLIPDSRVKKKINDLNLEKSNCTLNQENNAYEKAGAIRANLITEKINDLNREKDNCTSNQEKIPNWPF